MSILSEVKELLEPIKVPVETGAFSGEAVDTYIVLVPLTDTYPLSSDDKPTIDYQELRITLFTKNNYLKIKNRIQAIMISHYFFISARKYNGLDTETGYHQYTIDVAKNYEIEEDET